MVIIAETKDLLEQKNRPANPFANPPPPYSHPPESSLWASPSSPASATGLYPSSFFPRRRNVPTLTSLPQHILLQVVNLTCPSISSSHISPEEHTQALYWLSRSLRLVSRGFYVAAMHVLRSSYLPLYVGNTKWPYTSDPFPATADAGGWGSSGATALDAGTVLVTSQRETGVLDLFIALKVSEDMRADSTELHLDLDSFKDVFELMQPRARTEDLVRHYGVRAGLITLNPPTRSNSPFSQQQPAVPISFSLISVNFSPRKASLLVNRRTIVSDVKRDRDETLESIAKRLVKGLAAALGYEIRPR